MEELIKILTPLLTFWLGANWLLVSPGKQRAIMGKVNHGLLISICVGLALYPAFYSTVAAMAVNALVLDLHGDLVDYRDGVAFLLFAFSYSYAFYWYLRKRKMSRLKKESPYYRT